LAKKGVGDENEVLGTGEGDSLKRSSASLLCLAQSKWHLFSKKIGGLFFKQIMEIVCTKCGAIIWRNPHPEIRPGRAVCFDCKKQRKREAYRKRINQPVRLKKQVLLP